MKKYFCIISINASLSKHIDMPIKRSMKKYSKYFFIICLFSTLGFLAFLSGCSKQETDKQDLKGETKSETKTDKKKIVIKFWDYARIKEVSEWQKDVIKKFEAEHPECEVQKTNLAWAEGQTKILISANSGTPPDVVSSGFMEQLLLSNVYEPVDEYIADEKDDFYPASLKPFEYKGKHYAVPFYFTAYVLVLNLDYFEQYGVEPPANGVWNIEQFNEALNKLTFKADGTPTGITGMSFNVSKEHFETWGFLYSQGVRILNEAGDKCAFNSPESIRAIKNLIDMEKNWKTAYSAKGSMNQEESWGTFFYQRKSAISPQGIWSISVLNKFEEFYKENQNKTAENKDENINENKSDNKDENKDNIKEEKKDEAKDENKELNKDEKKDENKDGIRKDIRKKWQENLKQKPFKYQIALFPYYKDGKPILTSAGYGNFVVFKQKDEQKRKLCFELIKKFTSTEGQRFFCQAQTQFPTRKSVGTLFDDNPYLSRIQPYISEAISHPCSPGWNRIDEIVQKYIQLALLGTMTPEEAVAEAEKEINNVLKKYAPENN